LQFFHNNAKFIRLIADKLLAKDGIDIWFLNADFEQFVSLIPDLKALSRSQKLEQAVLNSVKGSL
jgi:hypothetical protein